MKAHIGVDACTVLTHSLTTTSANEHDLNQTGELLHGLSSLYSVIPVTMEQNNAPSCRMCLLSGLSLKFHPGSKS